MRYIQQIFASIDKSKRFTLASLLAILVVLSVMALHVPGTSQTAKNEKLLNANQSNLTLQTGQNQKNIVVNTGGSTNETVTTASGNTTTNLEPTLNPQQSSGLSPNSDDEPTTPSSQQPAAPTVVPPCESATAAETSGCLPTCSPCSTNTSLCPMSETIAPCSPCGITTQNSCIPHCSPCYSGVHPMIMCPLAAEQSDTSIACAYCGNTPATTDAIACFD